MLEILEERKSSTVLDEQRDLMSNWIHASMAGDKSSGKEPTLTQREILGNVFTFLIAGTILFLNSSRTDPRQKGTKPRRIPSLLHWPYCQFTKRNKRSSISTSTLWYLRAAFPYVTRAFV